MGSSPRTTPPTNAAAAPGPRAPLGQRAATALDTARAAIGVGTALIGGGLALADLIRLYGRRQREASVYQQDLMFPSDLIQPGKREFYISLKFMAYEKRSITQSPFLRSSDGIRLPLPSNLTDSSSVSYSATSFSPAIGAMLEQLSSRPGRPGGTGNLEDAIGTIGRTIGAGAEGAAVNAAQNALGEAGKAAQALAGVAVNPFQTILFEKPEFKTHSFNWKLMPRDEEETNQIKNIVRTFQYHMHPGISDQRGLFFTYPSMVIVSLFPSSRFLYRFKPCVVESFNVNYAAGGNPSFFNRTKAPTTISISVNLKEIEYWTKNDYTGNAFNETMLGSR